MDIWLFLLIVTIAIGIGTLASLFGIGGGFLLYPTMLLFLGLTEQESVASISLVIVFMAFSSVLAYGRQKRIDFKVTGIIAISTIAGSVIGAITTNYVQGNTITILFGTVEAVLAIILGLKRTPEPRNKIIIQSESKWYIMNREHVDSDGAIFKYSIQLVPASIVSFIAGFFSSLLGIGGGTLYIQIFVFLCGMTIHMAIACSMMTIFVSAISSFSTFVFVGEIYYLIAIAFGIGMVIGAQMGARINKRIKSKYLKPLAAGLILFISIRMIILAITGA